MLPVEGVYGSYAMTVTWDTRLSQDIYNINYVAIPVRP